MQKYFCDVCGKEFAPKDGVQAGYDALMACPNVMDVCPKCAAKGAALDVEKIVLAAWKAGTGKKKGRKPSTADGASKPVGRPKKNKQEDTAGAKAGPDAESVEAGDIGHAADDEADEVSADASVSVSKMPSAPVTVPKAPIVPADVTRIPAVPATKPRAASASSSAKTAAAAPKRSADGHEKRDILGKLIAYRRLHGLGAMDEVAKAAGISDSTIMGMLNAMPQDISVWRQVGKALDKLAQDDGVKA